MQGSFDHSGKINFSKSNVNVEESHSEDDTVEDLFSSSNNNKPSEQNSTRRNLFGQLVLRLTTF